jgi:hypothetical protein
MIMGNPFHFLVGPGATSNTPDTANAVGVTHRWYYAMNSVGGSLKLLFEEFSFLGPLMIVATIVLLVVIVVKKRWIDFDFLMIFWSIAIFTVLIGYRGFLPGFTRYFIWLIPGGILVMGAVYQTLEAKWLRLVANFFVIVLLLFPMLQQVSTKWYANEQPLWEKTILTWMIAGEEQDFSAENGNMIDLKIIAEYLNQQPDGTTTLADHSLASVLGLMVDRPKDLIMTTDTDFSEILRNPPSNVDQILVPYPSFDAKGRSEVLKLYPGIYDGFETWTTFLYEFPTSQQWRLYLVNNPEKVEN